ncbi:MAG: YbjN domain-containing protein [Desulfatibacillaceae bacterium]
MSWRFEVVKKHLEDLALGIAGENEERELLLVRDEATGILNMVVDCSSDVIVLEQFITVVPETGRDRLFERLLQLNRELSHGAFAVDADTARVLFRDTHLFGRLHENHIEASLRSLEKALADNGAELAALSTSS